MSLGEKCFQIYVRHYVPYNPEVILKTCLLRLGNCFKLIRVYLADTKDF
jgi:hypothetical protein